MFTPRDLEDEVKRVIQRGIKTKPAVIAAIAYFLCRSRNTETFVPLRVCGAKIERAGTLPAWCIISTSPCVKWIVRINRRPEIAMVPD